MIRYTHSAAVPDIPTETGAVFTPAPTGLVRSWRMSGGMDRTSMALMKAKDPGAGSNVTVRAADVTLMEYSLKR